MTGTNNLGRTEVSVGQTQKELAINNSDGIIDAALTDELTVTWAGADALKVLSTTELQRHAVFIMSGSTSDPTPTLKMAAVQRGFVVVKNDLSTDVIVEDFTTINTILVAAGDSALIYVTATDVSTILTGTALMTAATFAELVTATDTAKFINSAILGSLWKKGADTASAGTTTFGDGGFFHVTGTTGITALAFTDDHAGRAALVEFTGALTLTHNATSLILPTGADIMTVAGDTALFVSEGSGNFRCVFYQRKSGDALGGASLTYMTAAELFTATDTTKTPNAAILGDLWKKGSDVTAAATVTFGDDGRYFTMLGSTGITALAFTTDKSGRIAHVKFSGTPTITHNATSLILPGGANITAAAGDTATFVSEGSGNFRCLAYHRADGTSLVGGTIATAAEVEVGTNNTKVITPLRLTSVLYDGGDITPSAGTATFGDGLTFRVLGTSTITAFAFTNDANGRRLKLRFNSAASLTHNATTLILPGGTSIVCTAGDFAEFVSDGTGNFRCTYYMRADGSPLTANAATNAEVELGANATKAVTPLNLQAIEGYGGIIASAGTLTLTDGYSFQISGTTTITALAFTNDVAGRRAALRFSGSLTLTHNGTSLILPTGANIQTAAGDTAVMFSAGSGNFICLSYQRKDGTALDISAASTTEVLTGSSNVKTVTPLGLQAVTKKGADVASSGTTTFGDGAVFHVTGTTTITALAFTTDYSGRMVMVEFTGALTLTHNGTSLILPGAANITTVAGDTAIFVSEGSGNFRCISYNKTTKPFNAMIEFVIDGGGSVITAGAKGYIEIPFDCTIDRVTMLADISGSVVVDLYKTTYSSFDAGSTHPVSGDKITASAPPTISSATKSQDTTLTGWTLTMAAGDVLGYQVTGSPATITRVTVSLRVVRS